MYKPKPVRYKNRNLPCTLEAQWLSFFDDFDLRYTYEPALLTLPDGTLYKADTYLPTLNVWFEVKGSLDVRHLTKPLKLWQAFGGRGVVIGASDGHIAVPTLIAGELSLKGAIITFRRRARPAWRPAGP